MYALLISAIFMSSVGYLAVLHSFGPASKANSTRSEALVGNFNSYINSVERYARVNPGFVGVVPDSSLTFSDGHIRNQNWTNELTSSVIVVYSKAVSTSIFASNAHPLDRGPGAGYVVGIVSGGRVVTPSDGVSSLTVPGVVPNGALAWVSSR